MNLRQKIAQGIGVGNYEIITHFSRYMFGNTININNSGSRCFVIGTATNGNVGDIAISYAQHKLLEKYYNNVIDIPTGHLWDNLKDLKRLISKNDTVFIQGGGNMGDMYTWHENERCAAMELLPAKRFIIFPQTLSYSNDGSSLLKYTQRIYSSSKYEVILFAREHYSYDLMKQYYCNVHSMLVPDIVLSLGGDCIFKQQVDKQNKIILCLRNDIERNISDSVVSDIINFANKERISIQKQDTYIDDMYIQPNERSKFISRIVKTFKSGSLVITDRLHGMVFSAIAGVPCVVLGNVNHKVKGVYEDWLANLNYINYVNDLNDIKDIIKNTINCENAYFPVDFFDNAYQPITNLLK